MNLQAKDVIRFWSKVLIGDDCWEWQASKKNGYGQFKLNGKRVSAHRLSYQVFFDCDLDQSVLVTHICDNPGCIRPDHLFAGTHQDNADDVRKAGTLYKNRLEECKRGHDLSETRVYRENGRGTRCIECHRMDGRESSRKRRSNAKSK